jgi:hypothetical protein
LFIDELGKDILLASRAWGCTINALYQLIKKENVLSVGNYLCTISYKINHLSVTSVA